MPADDSLRRLAVAGLVAALAVVSAGCTTPASNNEPPVAVFDLPKEVVEVNELVILNANNSHDKEGKLILFQWNFGDGAVEVGPVVAHRYVGPGVFSVTLTVTDEQGAQNSRAANLTVNAPPTAALEVSPGPYFAKEAIAFSAANSRDPDGRIQAYLWAFGDGETATTASAAHAYRDTGAFAVRLEVTDDRGARANATVTLFADLHTYDVSFAEQTSTQAPIHNFTFANQTKQITVEVFELNITRVSISLTWRDPLPAQGPPNDIIELKVTSPDGPSQTMTGNSTNITLEFNVNGIPSPVQVRAATAADVPGVLGDAYVGSRGVGVWVIEVTAVSLVGGLVQDQGFVPEPFFFWTLTTSLTAYSAEPQQIS